jgi:hypothetical protein
MQIDEEPLFHIDEINPTLYNVITEINKAKVVIATIMFITTVTIITAIRTDIITINTTIIIPISFINF